MTALIDPHPDDPNETKPAAPPTPPAVHRFTGIPLGTILTLSLVARIWYGHTLGDTIAVEPERVAEVETRIDPNTAEWHELARLPGVGESLARAIVDYRSARQAGQTTNRPVFRSPADLDAVDGVGPRLLERIAPRLRFDTPPASNDPNSAVDGSADDL
jgi:hypothetical protein